MKTDLTKRRFLVGVTGAAIAAPFIGRSQAASDQIEFDVIVVGGGNAGMPAAIFAADRGARVLIIEASGQLGGTLLLSGGRMSAAGTKLQKSLGIKDHPDIHFEDIMRLARGTAGSPELIRLAVDNAAPAFDWLMDNGFVTAGDPVMRGMTHEGQTRARYVWSPEGGVGILNVLDKMIAPHIASGQITVKNNTNVIQLDIGSAGKIYGVKSISEEGMEQTWRGRNIVLTSGGYTSNPKMFAELEGALDYSNVSHPNSQGIGIELGFSAGGFVRGGEDHLPGFGGIPNSGDIPSAILAGIIHYPPDRQPWEIWVNARGDRFIEEDVVSVHDKELAAIRQPHERFWVVFDDSIFESAPPVVGRWSREEIASAFNSEFAFTSANTLEQLAAKTGIDPVGLKRTIGEYNKGQATGADKFHRKHMPRPIKDKPYYAIRVQGSQLIGFAGLAVDNELRVLRSDLTSIPNLYAAGEVLGAGPLQGQAYFGGMMVTPALAFGRRLGMDFISI